MASAYNPNVVKVEMRYTWDTEEVENTLYFFLPAPHSAEGLAILGAELYDVWATEFRPLQSASVSLREIYLRSMSGLVAPEYTFTTGLPAIGTNTQAPLPNNVTLSISFRSGLTGRSSRGRNFILGMTEDQVAQNLVAPAVIAAYVAAYEQLLPAASRLGSAIWVVYSQYSGGVIRPSGTFNFVLSVVVVDNVVDSQRRRLPGRGQ